MTDKGNILVAGDTPANLKLLADTLTVAGYQVCPADSGELALAAVAANPPDLILLDIRTKGLDGLEVCRRLKAREESRHIPIILIGAFTDVQEWVKGLQLGAADYITEPFQTEALLIRVRTHLALSRAKVSLEQRAAALRQTDKQLQSEIAERQRVKDELCQSLDRAERSRRAMLSTLEDQKRAAKALQENETQFRGFIENAGDIVYALTAEGTFTYVSPNWLEIMGEPAAEAVGKSVEAYLHPDDVHLCREFLERVFQTGERLTSVDYRVLHRGGSFRWHHTMGSLLRDKDGHAVGFMGIARDITERKQAEEKIREQAALLDQTNDAILVQTLAGTITFWNRGAERLFGWTAHEILGRRTVETLLAAVPRGQLEEAERQVLEQGYWLCEMNYVTKTGQELIGQARATLVGDAAGAPQSLLILITDLTEQKKLEKQFLRAQRLEAVGTLASGIAHDLNNILTPILMAAPFLREVQNRDEMTVTLDLIESSARRAADVVRQLLTFSRGKGGKRITLHLKHLLSDLRNVIRETFPKNINFTSEEAPDLWPLMADPTQLHQILLNLCINARDAMPEGGTLAVTAVNFQVDDHYASMMTGAKPGAYIHLQVSDTGTGIRPEHLDKIFDPFFTTKEVGRGTGLGLASVHKMVTSHGGFVAVRSRVGQGTTFDVYLPASPGTVALTELALPTSAQAGQGELILVVDDEEGIRKITQLTLLRHGYRTVTASDGAEAIATFAERREEVKAIITDLMMPVMDGLVLMQVLTKMTPALPVVVSTGLSSASALKEKLAALQRLGVSVILTKPYTAVQLLRALQKVLPPPDAKPHAGP